MFQKNKKPTKKINEKGEGVKEVIKKNLRPLCTHAHKHTEKESPDLWQEGQSADISNHCIKGSMAK